MEKTVRARAFISTLTGLVVLFCGGCVRSGGAVPNGKGYVVGTYYRDLGVRNGWSCFDTTIARMPIGKGDRHYVRPADHPRKLPRAVYDRHRDRYYCQEVPQRVERTDTVSFVSVDGSTGEVAPLCELKLSSSASGWVGMDISPDSRYLLFTADDSLDRYDLPDGEWRRLAEPEPGGEFGKARVLNDGTVYLSVDGDALYTIDPRTGAMSPVCKVTGTVRDVSPDGKLCAVQDGTRTDILRLPEGEPATDLLVDGLNEILWSYEDSPSGRELRESGWPPDDTSPSRLTFVGPRQVAYKRVYAWWWTLPVTGVLVYDLETGKEHLLARGDWFPLWYMQGSDNAGQRQQRP